MKKIVIFIGGIICGVLLLLVIHYTIQRNSSVTEDIEDVEDVDGDTIIEGTDTETEYYDPFYSDAETNEPGEVIHEKSLKVIEVGDEYNALVIGKDEYGTYSGTSYLLKQSVFARLNKEMITFYDNQIIKVPKGKELRMFGTYTYESRGAGIRTIPIIRFVDK